MPKRTLSPDTPGLLPEADRPRCLICDKPLIPQVTSDSERVETAEGYHSRQINHRVWGYGYMGQGVFCTLRCGYRAGLKYAALKGRHPKK